MAFLVALCATPLLTPVLRRYALLDHPNARSAHEVPTPRGGGVAAGVACVAGIGAVVLTAHSVAWAVVGCGLAMGLLGLVEDVRGVSPVPRLAVQGAVAAGAAPFLVADVIGAWWWAAAVGIVGAFGIVAFTNAFNFMDGINGISATQALVAAAAFAILGSVEGLPALQTTAIVLGGAALGFLPFNFPHARVFLGDVGSYLLGGWLAASAVYAIAAGVQVEAALAPLAVYLVDTGTTLVRRVRAGATWHEAHADHVFQQLRRLGLSHGQTTAVVGVTVALVSALGLVSLGAAGARVVADLLIVTVLVAYLASPALVARRPAIEVS